MKRRMQRTRASVNGLAVVGSIVAGAAGAWVWYSNFRIDHHVYLPDAIPAAREMMLSDIGGRVSYYVDRSGTGRPLVLVHSVNAAASAYEMRPLFQQYRGQRPVFALDLPGYGFSERANRLYTPQIFAGTLRDLLTERVGAPADIVALSLGSEFAARVAFDAPELVHSLALISPSGLNSVDEADSTPSREGSASDTLHSLLSFPLWGRPLYDLIVTRGSIRYFLEKSFVGSVPPELIEYDYATSHQPGAEHVPLYFISGALFTKNIARGMYERLTVPTLVLYDRDAYTNFDVLPDVLRANSLWQARRIAPTRGLPHFEKLQETVNALDSFWRGLSTSRL